MRVLSVPSRTGQRVTVMSPDWSVTVIRCLDDVLLGTVTTVEPDRVLAVTWYSVLPGGRTSLISPDSLLTRTRAGTAAKVSVMLPDRS